MSETQAKADTKETRLQRRNTEQAEEEREPATVTYNNAVERTLATE